MAVLFFVAVVVATVEHSTVPLVLVVVAEIVAHTFDLVAFVVEELDEAEAVSAVVDEVESVTRAVPFRLPSLREDLVSAPDCLHHFHSFPYSFL